MKNSRTNAKLNGTKKNRRKQGLSQEIAVTPTAQWWIGSPASTLVPHSGSISASTESTSNMPVIRLHSWRLRFHWCWDGGW